ncbi:MAG: DegV family protein [Anaerolineae bacterium]
MGERQVGVVIDSAADLPPALAREWDITVIPCLITFGSETYRDEVDLPRQVFYQRLRAAKTLPTTSAPSVGTFVEAYRELGRRTRSIISIHVASALTNIYNVARLATESLPELDIHLVDSRQISMCTGMLALTAARLAEEGISVTEILSRLQEMIPRLRLVAALDTLEFLHRGGRVSWAASMLGSLIDLKLVVELKDASLRLLDKVRGRRKSLLRMIQHVLEGGPLERVALLHADAADDATEVRRLFAPYIPPSGMIESEAGATIGTHAGPGAVGFCLLTR